MRRLYSYRGFAGIIYREKAGVRSLAPVRGLIETPKAVPRLCAGSASAGSRANGRTEESEKRGYQSNQRAACDKPDGIYPIPEEQDHSSDCQKC